MQQAPDYLKSLPKSLESFTLIYTDAVPAAFCRKYSDCLPNLSHLSNLKSLSLRLGGVVGVTSLQHIASLPLHSLYLAWIPDFTVKGITDTKETASFFTEHKTLKKFSLETHYQPKGVLESEISGRNYDIRSPAFQYPHNLYQLLRKHFASRYERAHLNNFPVLHYTR